MQFGGNVSYVGFAVSVVVKSAQIPVVDLGPDDLDIVVLSSWGNLESFSQFRAGLKGWSRHVAQGFNRNAVLNLLIPVAMLALKLKSLFTGDIDLSMAAR